MCTAFAGSYKKLLTSHLCPQAELGLEAVGEHQSQLGIPGVCYNWVLCHHRFITANDYSTNRIFVSIGIFYEKRFTN